MAYMDAVIVGAGVIGLAVARALAEAGQNTLLIESTKQFGSGTSSRNSEVIHAGIYYQPDSLKARLCVSGRDLLYAYCEQRAVPHKMLGKIIFAASTFGLKKLDAIEVSSLKAGAGRLSRLTAPEVRRLEPELDCMEALYSPFTGIVDSHAYMTALLADFENAGGTVAYNTRFVRALRTGEHFGIVVHGEDKPAVKCAILVNCAGLEAQKVASAVDGLDNQHIPSLYYAKGTYFSYSKRVPFSHLVYPTPEPGGLGIHLTLDLAGNARFGPNVEWVDDIDYSITPESKESFVQSALRIWPQLNAAHLYPGMVGMRPKLSRQGERDVDFRIDGPALHGISGLVNLFGIESPGLTASMAIANVVLDHLALGSARPVVP